MQQPTQAPVKSARIFEIDVLRGVAIVLMALFHLLFDLAAYFGQNINLYSGLWFYVGRFSAILFMLLSGVSSSFGGRQFRRGLMVLAAALVVTLASLPIMGTNYIRFGILHFFAACMLLKALFDKFIKNYYARLVAALALVPFCFFMGRFAAKTAVNTFWLLPLGFMYPGFSSFDYYPLFPWAALFCLGVALGMVVYPHRKSLFSLDITRPQTNPFFKGLCALLRPFAFLGRHSLPVYLLHQPLILGVLFLLSWLGAL